MILLSSYNKLKSDSNKADSCLQIGKPAGILTSTADKKEIYEALCFIYISH